jgi:hypothetical protein
MKVNANQKIPKLIASESEDTEIPSESDDDKTNKHEFWPPFHWIT